MTFIGSTRPSRKGPLDDAREDLIQPNPLTDYEIAMDICEAWR